MHVNIEIMLAEKRVYVIIYNYYEKIVALLRLSRSFIVSLLRNLVLSLIRVVSHIYVNDAL